MEVQNRGLQGSIPAGPVSPSLTLLLAGPPVHQCAHPHDVRLRASDSCRACFQTRSLTMRARWILLAALLPSSLAAQRPQTREGFWISFGVGQGNLRWECDGCATQDHGGPTGFIRLGGTPSKKVLLGAEMNGWSLDIGAAEITALTTTFTVYWYPSATGGLFLKGGVGGG